MSDPSTKPPVILAIDPDPGSQKLVARAFNGPGGFHLRYVGDPRKTVAGLRQLQPELLLVHAELQSPVMAEVQQALASEPMFASLPMVLLAKEVGDQPWAVRFRSGVVYFLQEPFDPQRHVAEVRDLFRSLRFRTGMLQGRGQPGELAALIAHVKRAQRTGALSVTSPQREQGSALFVRGALRSASFRTQSGDDALWAMVGQGADAWSFAELAGQAGDGAGVVIEVGPENEAWVDLHVGATPQAPAPQAPAPQAATDGDALSSPELDELETLFSPPAPGPRAQVEQGEPISVLLVDDDPELLRMFSIILQRRGVRVTTAADGVEGYARARAAPYDVLVADLAMPRMDGWGLLRQIRDDYRTREMPVAFLSCHDDYRESLRALNAGAQAYLSKSVKHDVLASQIRALLQPRYQVRGELQARRGFQLPVDLVGAQWLVQELAKQGVTGRLDVKDDWASYVVAFRGGEVVGAAAQAGPHSATGEPAFIALLASRSAAGMVTFQDPGVPMGTPPLGPVDQLIDRAVHTLNEKERRAREALLVNARLLAVDPNLYALYAQVGPKQWLRTAKLICEDRLSPADVISHSDASPLDVEETLKDLLRRGVVSLQA